MKMKDFIPLDSAASLNGVKAILYGGPGTGKTPMVATCPRPIICLGESGGVSVRDKSLFGKIPCVKAYDMLTIRDFFKWIFESTEVKNFDTIYIDSMSQIAETALEFYKPKFSHGQKVYGAMVDEIMPTVDKLFFMEQKHIVLVAQCLVGDKDERPYMSPYFPGNALKTRIPHRYDEILYADRIFVQGQQDLVPVLRTKEAHNIKARDRSLKLNEYEPTHLGNLFNKCMQ